MSRKWENGYGEKLLGWVGKKLRKDGFRKLKGITGFGKLSKLRVRWNNDIAAIKGRKYANLLTKRNTNACKNWRLKIENI